jgi:GntR family transcriptional regulator, histidine utilization repressor
MQEEKDMAQAAAHDRTVGLKSSPQPLYQKVKDHILGLIQEGAWAPDTCIPSENQLVEQLKVSRMTVNRALRELTGAGYLVRLQGVGTFVAHPKPLKTLLEIRSIVDEIQERGGSHSCDVELLAEERAFTELAIVMQIPVGAPVFHLVMVNRDRGIPVQLADEFVNPIMAPDYLQQDFTRINPTDYLLKHIPVTDVEHIIEALRPDAWMQKLLGIDHEEPCLMLHRQTWCGDRVATHSRYIFPGTRYRIGGRFKPLPIGSREPLGVEATFAGGPAKTINKRIKR